MNTCWPHLECLRMVLLSYRCFIQYAHIWFIRYAHMRFIRYAHIRFIRYAHIWFIRYALIWFIRYALIWFIRYAHIRFIRYAQIGFILDAHIWPSQQIPHAPSIQRLRPQSTSSIKEETASRTRTGTEPGWCGALSAQHTGEIVKDLII